MAFEVLWMLTALIILATVCIGVSKGISDGILFRRSPRDFLLNRLARYGDPFTVSFLGRQQTVISSPETIKFVLSTAHASFSVSHPTQVLQLLDDAMFVDERHPHFRKIMLSAASGDGLRKLVPFISSLAEKTVKSWENQAVVKITAELKKFTLNVGMHIIWKGVDPGSEEMDQIRNNIVCVAEGLVAFPINFPGFSFHKAVKARQFLVSRIQSEISRRRKAGIHQDDVLNALMSMREVEVPDYDICSIMVGFMYAFSETTAALILWVLKYLDNLPEVHQRVQEEQDGLQQKMIEDKSLTWFKPKSSMPYTLQVIYEIMRIESLVTVIPRQANKDVDYNGLVLPKGSYLWASPTSRHYDPKYHPNPREFNPSRFVEKPEPNAFMPFGQGPHLCPGSELALTETMFIIHHLITNYSWKRCGRDERVQEIPVRKPLGFQIRLVKRCKT